MNPKAKALNSAKLKYKTRSSIKRGIKRQRREEHIAGQWNGEDSRGEEEAQGAIDTIDHIKDNRAKVLGNKSRNIDVFRYGSVGKSIMRHKRK